MIHSTYEFGRIDSYTGVLNSQILTDLQEDPPPSPSHISNISFPSLERGKKSLDLKWCVKSNTLQIIFMVMISDFGLFFFYFVEIVWSPDGSNIFIYLYLYFIIISLALFVS